MTVLKTPKTAQGSVSNVFRHEGRHHQPLLSSIYYRENYIFKTRLYRYFLILLLQWLSTSQPSSSLVVSLWDRKTHLGNWVKTESQNQIITESGRTSEDCPVQTPCSKQSHLEQVAQGHVQSAFDISMDGDSTTSLDYLFQCSLSLILK